MAMQDSTQDMTDDRLAEMRSDLDFKQSQMDHSVTTSEKLQRELAQRKVELQRSEHAPTLALVLALALALTPTLEPDPDP